MRSILFFVLGLSALGLSLASDPCRKFPTHEEVSLVKRQTGADRLLETCGPGEEGIGLGSLSRTYLSLTFLMFTRFCLQCAIAKDACDWDDGRLLCLSRGSTAAVCDMISRERCEREEACEWSRPMHDCKEKGTHFRSIIEENHKHWKNSFSEPQAVQLL